MARRGRKRKNLPRRPSGRIARPERQGPLVPIEVMRRRIDHVGLEDAMTIAGGRAPSALAKWGIITEDQRLAAEKYRGVYEWWRKTQGMRNRHEAPAYYPVASTPDEAKTREESRKAAEWAAMTPEEQGAAQERDALDAEIAWSKACDVVARVKPIALVRATLDMVCIEDVAPETWSLGIVAPVVVQALRTALDQLVKHFKIGERDRERRAAVA